VLRVLRLVKLLRLLRASRILKRWETHFSINYALLTLSRSSITVLLMAHWLACIWTLQATLQDDLGRTWLGNNGYCKPDPNEDGNFLCSSPFQLYAVSLYWAIVTITSIGYGDISVSPPKLWSRTRCTPLLADGNGPVHIVLGS
jgi:hypothetical protein